MLILPRLRCNFFIARDSRRILGGSLARIQREAIMQSVFGSAVVATTLMLVGGCGSKDNGGGAAGGGDPRLEGTYTLVETEMGGVRSKETEQKGTFSFSGDKMISPNGKKEEAATIKCDPSKTPAEITISKTEVSGKIDTFYGIYKFE